MDFDLIVKNGLIITSTEVLPAGLEIGVKDGKISCIGTSLAAGKDTKIIDAEGAYITPGGVDSHVHLSQDMCPAGDNWESGTRSAVAGGTTTVLAFATQKKHEDSVLPVVQAYHDKANMGTYTDYGFHLILTNPTEDILKNELPVLSKEGITSIKLYMTYEPLRLGDRDILDVMMTTRSLGFTTMIHCENNDMLALITDRLEALGLGEPFYHAVSRPMIAEKEATYRAIALAELLDTPILIVHMSSPEALKSVRKAQTRMLPIHAETCPQYLFLLSENLKGKPHKHFEGAKFVCSPPLRHSPKDLEPVWEAIANGTITTFSSDHAPSTFDDPRGKKLGLVDGIPRYRNIPNGLPGVETRVPLLFDQAIAEDPRLGLPRFVQVTSTNPAKLYGLEGVKGSIAPGYDADLVIWYPEGHNQIKISQEMLHHAVDYCPYEGMTIRNWPRYTILRGTVAWDRDNGGVVGAKGAGKFLKRGKAKVLTGRQGNHINGMFVGEREIWHDGMNKIKVDLQLN